MAILPLGSRLGISKHRSPRTIKIGCLMEGYSLDSCLAISRLFHSSETLDSLEVFQRIRNEQEYSLVSEKDVERNKLSQDLQ